MEWNAPGCFSEERRVDDRRRLWSRMTSMLPTPPLHVMTTFACCSFSLFVAFFLTVDWLKK